MDRDAPLASPTSPADAVPLYDARASRNIAFIGLGLCGAAVLLGVVAAFGGDSTPLNSMRVALVFIGMVTTGAAISMRPDLWWMWGLGVAASTLGFFGLSPDWDSFHALLLVMAGVSVFAMLLRLSSLRWRIVIISAMLMFHFVGIFSAVTSPPTSPWLTDQAFTRVYNPYLQFIYMRNAYHFYSPEPGPASILAFLLKTETGTDPTTGRARYKTEWIVMPRKPIDVRDPLGLSYYRRLSLTEQLARGNAGLAMPNDQFEKTDVWYRRNSRTPDAASRRELDRSEAIQIPFHPTEVPTIRQYKLPNADVARFILPSYASHVILDFTPDKEAAAKTTVKVYRLEHQALPVDQFRLGLNPFHPGTYRPYFLGEYDARGNLLNPQEDFLYWMLPVVPRTPGPGDPNKKGYIDYMSVHATGMKPEEVLAADEKDGQVFDWNQLRWSSLR